MKNLNRCENNKNSGLNKELIIANISSTGSNDFNCYITLHTCAADEF